MKTVILAILDGWGIGSKNETNPIYVADPETIKYIEQYYPAGALNASGISVGLPWGEEGNSEVGHLTLGAGRVLYQYFLRINKSIENGDFFKNKALKNACQDAKENNSKLHLVGLLTEGNVHASMNHIEALLEMASKEKVDDIFVHLFSDGVDSGPKSVMTLLKNIKKKMEEEGVGKIASLSGRYYAMDKEKNWGRTEEAYKALIGESAKMEIEEIVKANYDQNLNDQYIDPSVVNEDGAIGDNDSIIFFNFREDSMKQIVRPFVDSSFPKFKTKDFQNITVATMTKYSGRFDVDVAFPPKKLKNTLGEVVAENGKNQLRVAETEKGAHVTYFFNGLDSEPFSNEFRILIPSLKVGRIEQEPQMQAEAITERVMISLQDNSFNFILVNYANPDVMAHTGNYKATKEAVKVVDKQINKLLKAAIKGDHTLIITSDHGNAEMLFDPKTGQEETRHNASPVPFYVVDKKFQGSDMGSPGNLPKIGMLADVAPTVLNLLDIEKPPEMTGNNLIDLIE